MTNNFISCGFPRTLVEHGLLTFPVVLGAGTVVSVYRRGGALRTGSFLLDDE